MNEERYSRQEALFGQTGQSRLAASRVAIAGLGGLGCHVAQQLAHAGVCDFRLADPDHVSISNLNRLVGARPDDAVDCVAKVAVAERMIRSIQREARICAVPPERVVDGRDILFSCVDSDAVRLELTDFCTSATTPFFDLATDTGDGWYGGRVLFSGYGERCASCMDLIDQESVRVETEGQQRERASIYGVSRLALAGTGPAVISINAVVASLAVTEFIKWRTALATPVSLATYRGETGVVLVSRDQPHPGCYYCAKWLRAAA